MSRMAATLRLDVTIQARSKLYAMGIGVSLLVGLLGRFFLDSAHAGSVLPAFYLLGIGSTTYIFGAGVVLFDKSQGTLSALRASPLTVRHYIGSKVVTLTGFAMVEGAIVYAVAFWGVEVDPIPLVSGVATLGVLCTLIGLGQVAAHDSVTSFLMPGAILVGSAIPVPVYFILEVPPEVAWYLVPTQGPLLLMLAGFEPLQPWQWMYAVAMSAAALIAAAWWAKYRFAKFIALQER